MTRILHVSDLHLENGFPGVSWQSFLNKRLVGLANLRLHRHRLFAEAPDKVRALAEFAESNAVDFIVCTGDFTALGTEPELAYARQVVEPLAVSAKGFFVVPGNHDLYLRDAVDGGWFERYFGEFSKNELPEYTADGNWPQVWFPSDDVAVVAVNSARPNARASSSSGRIPDAQIEALGRVLADPRVRDRFVLVATHYAPRLASGQPDRPRHGLENADAFLAATAGLRRGVIVHGHVHRRYHVRVPETTISLCCSGSTTHEGREGLWLLDLDAGSAFATPGRWDQTRYALEPELAVSLDA